VRGTHFGGRLIGDLADHARIAPTGDGRPTAPTLPTIAAFHQTSARCLGRSRRTRRALVRAEHRARVTGRAEEDPAARVADRIAFSGT
jgi:hypothetical protein